MASKDLEVSLLLDCYGNTLTQKQKSLLEFYYNDDLSLSEIAENEGITRQGVRDIIKRAADQLYSLEKEIGFLKFQQATKNRLSEIESACKALDPANEAVKKIKSLTLDE